MSEAQSVDPQISVAGTDYVEPGRLVVGLSTALALLAALGVVTMALATVYDVFVAISSTRQRAGRRRSAPTSSSRRSSSARDTRIWSTAMCA
jgi:hypothetical protein